MTNILRMLELFEMNHELAPAAQRDIEEIIAVVRAAPAPAAVPCHTCEELRDNLADALGGRLHSVDEKSQVIENLLAMIGRISDACGISAEDQSVASGDEEILFAIEELKAAATAPAPAAVPAGYVLLPLAWFDREIPRIDAGGPNPIKPEEHCCEWVLYLERERIHSAVAAMLAAAPSATQEVKP